MILDNTNASIYNNVDYGIYSSSLDFGKVLKNFELALSGDYIKGNNQTATYTFSDSVGSRISFGSGVTGAVAGISFGNGNFIIFYFINMNIYFRIFDINYNEVVGQTHLVQSNSNTGFGNTIKYQLCKKANGDVGIIYSNSSSSNTAGISNITSSGVVSVYGGFADGGSVQNNYISYQRIFATDSGGSVGISTYHGYHYDSQNNFIEEEYSYIKTYDASNAIIAELDLPKNRKINYSVLVNNILWLSCNDGILYKYKEDLTLITSYASTFKPIRVLAGGRILCLTKVVSTLNYYNIVSAKDETTLLGKDMQIDNWADTNGVSDLSFVELPNDNIVLGVKESQISLGRDYGNGFRRYSRVGFELSTTHNTVGYSNVATDNDIWVHRNDYFLLNNGKLFLIFNNTSTNDLYYRIIE